MFSCCYTLFDKCPSFLFELIDIEIDIEKKGNRIIDLESIDKNWKEGKIDIEQLCHAHPCEFPCEEVSSTYSIEIINH